MPTTEEMKMLGLIATKHYYTTLTLRKEQLDKVVSRTNMTPFIIPQSMELAIAHITAMVEGSTVKEIKHPADWWEAFRERWLPSWWLKYYPVNYTIWQIDRQYPPTYPDGIIRVYNSRKDSGYLRA